MATATKRAWKLQEFVAHGACVNCLALGRKSGRVLVTGGEDKKVNLWAVGKPNCIMSLTGHTTPIECVRFSYSDELVCAGSLSGALKIWDLEAAKIVRTLTGHKANIKSLDFHPYGDFLASGSTDTNVKLWDIKRKGCIFTYKGHSSTINSIKFSPDGRWIASAGEDGSIKIWDLPAGKMLAEFRNHSSAVRDVEFHPNEFLLASGSADRTVKFWDLESFQLVSSTDGDCSPVSCIYFSSDGECLFSGAQDVLKIYGWEPTRTFDSIFMSWGKIADIATAQNQLIGASFSQLTVSIYVVDLKRVHPFGGVATPSLSFQHGTHVRKSFIRQKPTVNSECKTPSSVQMKTEDDSIQTPEIDPGDDASSLADIKDMDDYQAIFQPRRRELARTPPLQRKIDPFPPPPDEDLSRPEPLKLIDPSMTESVKPELLRPEPQMPEPLRPELVISDQMRPDPSIPQIMKADVLRPEPVRPELPIRPEAFAKPEIFRVDPTKPDMNRIEPVKPEVSRPDTTKIDPSRTYNISYARAEQLKAERPASEPIKIEFPARPLPMELPKNCSEPTRSLPQVLVQPVRSDSFDVLSIEPESHHHPNKQERSEFLEYIPTQRDRPVGLDVDDFLPSDGKDYSISSRSGHQAQPDISEAEAISSIMKGHDSMMTVLSTRSRHLQIVLTLWTNKDVKTAVESAVQMNDQSVIVDILELMCLKSSLWTLDLCVILLQPIYELLQSKYEIYMLVGCSALKVVLKNFATLIKSNLSAPPDIGIDLQREERHQKCLRCYEQLVSIRAFILKRQALQGKLGHTFRDLHILMQVLD